MRALALVYLDAVRRGTGERGRQRTRNYRRGYIPALSLPSRAVVTSRLHSPAARAQATSYDVFCSGTKDCTARIASPLFSSAVRPTALTRPLKGPYRPAKSGDYPRTIVPGVYESARPAATCPPIARLDTLVIATAELPPASPPEQSSSSAAPLWPRAPSPASDKRRAASCER